MRASQPGAPAMTLRTTRPASGRSAAPRALLAAPALAVLALAMPFAPAVAQSGVCYATPADFDAVQAGMPVADVQKIMQCPPVSTVPAPAAGALPGARPPATLVYRARNSEAVSLHFENGRLAGKDGRPAP